MLPRRSLLCLAIAMAVPLAARAVDRPGTALWKLTPRDVPVPFERIDGPAISPDGQTLAFGALDADDRTHIFLVSADGGTPTPLTSGMNEERRPRFSADGKVVAFVSDRSGNADVWTVPAMGGQARQI